MKFEFILPRNTKSPRANMVINSNDRFHPQSLAKMVKNIRRVAYWQVREDKPTMTVYNEHRPCKVLVSVLPPTRRRLDPPNIYPTVKAIVDGLTDVGIWSDDNYTVIREMVFKFGGLSGIKGHYKIILEIEEV